MKTRALPPRDRLFYRAARRYGRAWILARIAEFDAAPRGTGPLASGWGDKPHRVLWSLCDFARGLAMLLPERP